MLVWGGALAALAACDDAPSEAPAADDTGVASDLVTPGADVQAAPDAVDPPDVAVEPDVTTLPSLPPLGPLPAEALCVLDPDLAPPLVSQTGCYAGAPLAPAADLVPYEVLAPLWTDGAIKKRYLVLAPGATIGFTETGEWDYPIGAILVKTFVLETVVGDPTSRRAVETRFMVKVPGTWRFFSYRWREDGSDADLLDAGMFVAFDIQTETGLRTLDYYFPDAKGCNYCHADESLGPRTDQLNVPLRYGDRLVNQLEAIAELGLFDRALGPVEALPALPNPSDPSASLEDRARSYLHGNCSHCHRPGGWTPPDMTLDLRFGLPLADMRACNERHQSDVAFGSGEYRIVPGKPGESVLWNRMNLEDLGRMPSIGTVWVDRDASQLVHAWISSLDGCP